MSSRTGLLVVSNIKHIGKSLRLIEKYVSSLYIHLYVPVKIDVPAPTWGQLISQLYADSTAQMGHKLDMRILVGPLKQAAHLHLKPVDMIFCDSKLPELCDKLRSQLNIPTETICLEEESSPYDIKELDASDKAQVMAMYNTVVLGGTFDRIHVGHKIFLTQAVLRAIKRLVVGVTTSAMTKSKTLPELILPVEERICQLRDFLMEIDNTLEYDIVPIDDPFGPTRTDPNMDMIVVSRETLRGGEKVNELRALNGLHPLKVFVIEIVESNVNDGIHETKVSSSNTRINLLGSRWRVAEPKPHLPASPYIIGLTGGIASGKSKMAERFAELGAYVIDCDKVAHYVYEPGQVCYTKIVEHFGKDIIGPNGLIDRTKLGPIVFSDANQLEKLNSIVWPELMIEVKRRLVVLRAGDIEKIPKIVVLEAAVLLKAGWETECHEVWSMIVPPKEAVRRVMERNGLNEEEAQKRVASQPNNTEIVAKSHVIFSSQWDFDFTQKQAEKAWKMLNVELANRSACKL